MGGTLVVCPASLLHHWHKEIERRTKPHLMTVVLYHGPQRTKDTKRWSSARLSYFTARWMMIRLVWSFLTCPSSPRLAKFDIVLTTYKIVALEAHGEDSEVNPSSQSTFPNGSCVGAFIWLPKSLFSKTINSRSNHDRDVYPSLFLQSLCMKLFTFVL